MHKFLAGICTVTLFTQPFTAATITGIGEMLAKQHSTPGILVVETFFKDNLSYAKLDKKLQNRAPLIASDTAAKAEIMSLMPQGKTSGIVYEIPEFTISYLETNDTFLVFIRTTAIEQAKRRAVDWFEGFGVSRQAICDYPVAFDLSQEVIEKLRGNIVVFSPLAQHCE
jgi:hypothetical protein